jgi:hypothetical protein
MRLVFSCLINKLLARFVEVEKKKQVDATNLLLFSFYY